MQFFNFNFNFIEFIVCSCKTKVRPKCSTLLSLLWQFNCFIIYLIKLIKIFITIILCNNSCKKLKYFLNSFVSLVQSGKSTS